jgi:hypothetical protein
MRKRGDFIHRYWNAVSHVLIQKKQVVIGYMLLTLSKTL